MLTYNSGDTLVGIEEIYGKLVCLVVLGERSFGGGNENGYTLGSGGNGSPCGKSNLACCGRCIPQAELRVERSHGNG